MWALRKEGAGRRKERDERGERREDGGERGEGRGERGGGRGERGKRREERPLPTCCRNDAPAGASGVPSFAPSPAARPYGYDAVSSASRPGSAAAPSPGREVEVAAASRAISPRRAPGSAVDGNSEVQAAVNTAKPTSPNKNVSSCRDAVLAPAAAAEAEAATEEVRARGGRDAPPAGACACASPPICATPLTASRYEDQGNSPQQVYASGRKLTPRRICAGWK